MHASMPHACACRHTCQQVLSVQHGSQHSRRNRRTMCALIGLRKLHVHPLRDKAQNTSCQGVSNSALVLRPATVVTLPDTQQTKPVDAKQTVSLSCYATA